MSTLKRELEQLYDAQGQPLYLCALAVTRCRDLAEDALHEAFRKLLMLERRPENLKAYTYRSVRNNAVDLLRRRGRTRALPEEFLFDAAPGPRDAAAGRELQGRVTEALLELADDARETIVQHLYAELTFREIAELREAPLGTVTSWYRRGLEELRKRLEE